MILLRTFILRVLVSAVTIFLCSQSAAAFRILMFPAQAASHVANFDIIASELVKNPNNEILFILQEGLNPSRENVEKENFNLIRYTARMTDIHNKSLNVEDIAMVAIDNNGDMDAFMEKAFAMYLSLCTQFFREGEAIMIQLEEAKVDLMMLDGFFLARCLYLVPHRLRVPFVTLSDIPEPWLMRTPWLPSFVPFMLMPFTEQMTFMERLKNLAVNLAWVNMPILPELPRDILGKYAEYGGEFGSLEEIAAKSRLWFISGHHTVDYPKPLMPNIIQVGGLTTKAIKPLPEELQALLDSSEQGVIVMTFGSMAEKLPRQTAETFLAAFQEIEQTVVWRFVNNDNLTIPKNVKSMTWLPQNDLLAHRNVRLFITHGGSNGQFEAVFNAVPMLAFPLFGDQPYNAARLVYRGFGLKLNVKTFTKEELVESISTVISDPSYKEKITKASRIFRSDWAIATPAQKVAYWIEHVAEFGSDHLMSYGMEMPWYKYLMFDIFLVVFIVVVVSFVSCYCCCVKVLTRICKRKHSKLKEKAT